MSALIFAFSVLASTRQRAGGGDATGSVAPNNRTPTDCGAPLGRDSSGATEPRIEILGFAVPAPSGRFRAISPRDDEVSPGALTPTQVPGDLPPWLQVNQETLRMMYGRGITDAGRNVRLTALSDKLRRDIGPADSRPIPGEADSYVWLIDPYVQAYQFGWRARHDDWTPEQITEANARLTDWATHGRKSVTFQVILNVVRPSPPGPLAHPSAPDVFRGVQVQLKVAGRRYDPERQPGDLAFFAGHGSISTLNDRVIPSPIAGVPGGPGEISTGSAQVTNYFTADRTLKYDFFQGHFTVVFDLFDDAGKPRVRPDDVAIGAIVITAGGNEHQALYKWTDLMDIRAAQ